MKEWKDWKQISGNIPVFEKLAEEILKTEGLPPAKLEAMPLSTNAVFRTGNYVLKIYAPRQAGMVPEEELGTERFAMWRAGSLGVPVPGIAAWGQMKDSYVFYYLISDYISGNSFQDAAKTMNPAEKRRMGERIRKLTDRMNTPCAPFRDVDVLTDPDRQVRWQAYPESFRKDRKAFLAGRCLGERVFVHGDLNGNNVLVDDRGAIWFLDFAEAVLAPAVYEQMYVAVELFQMDGAFLQGYFPELSGEALTERITEGLLIHDFGGDLAARYFGGPSQLHTVEDLKRNVLRRLEEKENAI